MIETSYFQWLCTIIHADSFEKSYYLLCGELFKYPFWVKVQRDINRANDGLGLRNEYFEEVGIDNNGSLSEDCSMLELFIGIAKRMNDELMTEDSGDKTHEYFWEMMRNLELDEFDDEKFGEIPVLVIESDDTQYLPELFARVLPKYWTPKKIVSVSALPLTETGKPIRDLRFKI